MKKENIYLNKLAIIFITFLTMFSFVNALQIQETTNAPTTTPPQNTSLIGGVTINWDVIIPVVIISIVIGLIAMFVLWFIGKIVKKIKSARRKMEDLEYYKYSLDLKNSAMNMNSKYKYRNIWTFFLLFKKANIYARTTRGRKFIGNYDGELVKKEGFFILAIELKYTFFKREIDLVIFPYELMDELIFFNQDGSIDLDIEGIDEVLSSELFSLPVFKNTSNKKSKEIFADFSDRVFEDYFEKFGSRKSHIDTIKDASEKIRQSTEINPQIPFKRKTGNDLQN